MKKGISILLLLVFLFNMVGYKLFFFYMEEAADRCVEARLDMLSDGDKQLIEVKIPINLPYHTNWKDFERVDGEVAFKGAIYKFVKRKVYRDTLILLCIDYKEKLNIQKSSEDYFKLINDLTAETSNKLTVKQVKTDYYEEIKTGNTVLYITYLTGFRCYSENNCHAGFVRNADIPPDVLYT